MIKKLLSIVGIDLESESKNPKNQVSKQSEFEITEVFIQKNNSTTHTKPKVELPKMEKKKGNRYNIDGLTDIEVKFLDYISVMSNTKSKSDIIKLISSKIMLWDGLSQDRLIGLVNLYYKINPKKK